MTRLKSKRYLITAILAVVAVVAVIGIAAAAVFQANKEVPADLALAAVLIQNDRLGLFSDQAGNQPLTALHFQGANFQPPMFPRAESQEVFARNLATDAPFTLTEPCRDIFATVGGTGSAVKIGFMDAAIFHLDGTHLGKTCDRKVTVAPQQMVRVRVNITKLVSGLPSGAAISFTAVFGAEGVLPSPSVTLVSSHSSLTNPASITTDGVNLYVGNGNSILSVPMGGGPATTLYPSATPCCVVGLTRIGANLFWIDPNGDPDATAIFRGSTSAATATKIYSGFATGQPIVDGVDITTDGVKLYTADEVNGRVHSLNTDGFGITELGRRYGGFFDLEHLNTIAENGGILYIADDGTKAASGIPPQVVSIPKTGGVFTTLHSGAPLVRPSGIAVGNGKVFVTDPGTGNTVWSLPIGGGAPTVLVSGAPFVQINRVIFFNNALYVTDTGNVGATDGPGAIYKVDLP